MIYDEEHYNQVLAVAKSYRNDVKRLENQLAITQKALELACEEIGRIEEPVQKIWILTSNDSHKCAIGHLFV